MGNTIREFESRLLRQIKNPTSREGAADFYFWTEEGMWTDKPSSTQDGHEAKRSESRLLRQIKKARQQAGFFNLDSRK